MKRQRKCNRTKGEGLKKRKRKRRQKMKPFTSCWGGQEQTPVSWFASYVGGTATGQPVPERSPKRPAPP